MYQGSLKIGSDGQKVNLEVVIKRFKPKDDLIEKSLKLFMNEIVLTRYVWFGLYQFLACYSR